MDYLVKDNDSAVYQTIALPNGAVASSGTMLDIGNGPFGDFVANTVLSIAIPALGGTPLPSGRVISVDIQHAASGSYSDERTLVSNVLSVSGLHDGTGAAAANVAYTLPTAVERYVRVVTKGSAVGNSSGSNATVRFLF